MTCLTGFQWDIFVQQIVAAALGVALALGVQFVARFTYRKWPRGRRV